jgi:hypothetical protein
VTTSKKAIKKNKIIQCMNKCIAKVQPMTIINMAIATLKKAVIVEIKT